MNQISLSEIKLFVANIAESLNDANADYLVYGSFVYQLLTGENMQVNDVDIIVPQDSFAKIQKLFKEMPFDLYVSEYSIHANSKEYSGYDGKPFDVSFDSYEKYFREQGFDIGVFDEVEIEGVMVKIMTKQDLIKLYRYSLEQGNKEKFPEYKRKINNLESLE